MMGILVVVFLSWFVPDQNFLAASSGPNGPTSVPVMAGLPNDGSPTDTPSSDAASDELLPANLNNGTNFAEAFPTPSWATPAPIITNFTDFTYLASLSLPRGVKAEGYVLFNPGTGVVDPRHDQGAIPLRFSTDPSTVFLPSVEH